MNIQYNIAKHFGLNWILLRISLDMIMKKQMHYPKSNYPIVLLVQLSEKNNGRSKPMHLIQ